jgi:hypothetical protein
MKTKTKVKRKYNKKPVIKAITEPVIQFEAKIQSGWKPHRLPNIKFPIDKLNKGEHFDVPVIVKGHSKVRAEARKFNAEHKNVYISTHDIKDNNKKLVAIRVYRKY